MFVNIDPFIIATGRANASYGAYQGYDHRTSFGARLGGTAGGLDFDLTGVYQTGYIGTAGVSAFGIFASSGYTFSPPTHPRVGGRFYVLSGDQHGGRVGNFYPMLSSGLHSTEIPLVAPVNQIQIGANFEFNP